MGRLAWIAGTVAALLAACAAQQHAMSTPLVEHAPTTHRGLRILLVDPLLSGPAAEDATGDGLAAALAAALERNLREVGYEVVRDPALASDFTLRLDAEVERAGSVRAALRLQVVVADRPVDEVEWSNRDARGWYETDRPWPDHAAVMLVNELVRSGPFLEAARGVVGRSRAAHRMAVLELQGGMPPDALATLTDVLRTAAVAPARKLGLAVMTREAMVEAVESLSDRPSCLDDACAVDLARRLGAEMVVTGEVSRLGDQVLLALQLHDARTSRLVRATTSRARSEEQLADGMTRTIRDLLED